MSKLNIKFLGCVFEEIQTIDELFEAREKYFQAGKT